MMCKLNFSGLWNIKGNLENLQSLANPFSGICHGSIFKLSQNSLKIGNTDCIEYSIDAEAVYTSE